MATILEERKATTAMTDVAQKLFAYCQAQDWAGYDPYDALNSSLLTTLPVLNSRIPRLILTQALKRSPINLRGALGVPKTQNPKGLALVLSALMKGIEQDPREMRRLASSLVDTLVTLRAPDTPYWCWGYSFPWQTRTIVVPRGAPNLVCTTFVAGALLDAYDKYRETRYLAMALSAAEYIRNELYWTDGASMASFSYPLPSQRGPIHNANFLAGALLCRLYKHSAEPRFLEAALQSARYSAGQQRSDGSWAYGEGRKQQWIDNFHTGYNLCALQAIAQNTGTSEFNSHIECGLAFYMAHFFREDGAAKYFHNCTYPIDIHCVAQSMITLATFSSVDPAYAHLAQRVFQWALDHMWDSRGFFYYRVLRSCTIRIPYMRWSQSWMLLAMATVLSKSD